MWEIYRGTETGGLQSMETFVAIPFYTRKGQEGISKLAVCLEDSFRKEERVTCIV